MGAYRLEVHANPLGSSFGDGSKEYPTRTLNGALSIVRRLRHNDQPVVIWLHEGDYELTAPLELSSDYSGVTFAAWREGDYIDEVRITGAQSLDQWCEDSINGRRIWVSRVDAHAGRTLYVHGERMSRPRVPHEGYLRIAGQEDLDIHADLNATLFNGANKFSFDPAGVKGLSSIHAWPGMEAVIPHFWIQERLPIASIDMKHGIVRSDYQTMLCLKDGDGDQLARFYFDGVAEALGQYDHEWLLDGEGVLSTDAKPNGYEDSVVLFAHAEGESLKDFTAVIPRLGQLLRIEGAHDIRFENVGFAYADWSQAPAAHPPFQMREDPLLDPQAQYASEPQGASTVPGAIELSHSTNCSFVDCSIEHVGGYGIRLDDGVKGTLISGCRMSDLGAGGVECGGAAASSDSGFNSHNEISDCIISDGGKVYPQAVAVFLRHGAHNTVAYNDISRFESTAVACGWRWDYGKNDSTDNRIVGNHLHHLGGDQLNWFGAVYTLGVSPGTVVSNNLIHDVKAADFGGWGILVDPATSGVEFTGNIIHSVSSECLHIKTGRANIITGNLLAYGGMGQISLAVPEDHIAAIVTHNVIVGDGTPAFAGSPGSASVKDVNLLSDANIIWDDAQEQQALLAADGSPDESGAWTMSKDLSDDWHAKGNDIHSVVTDPGISINQNGSVTVHDIELWQREGMKAVFAGVQGPRAKDKRMHPQIQCHMPYEQ